MSVNETHPYNFPPSQANEFERKGHPGKFLKSITCTTGTTNFTGSNYGQGGLIVATGAIGTASLSGGGEIPLSTFAGSQRIIDLSLSFVKVDSGIVYALIKNQLVR